MRSNVTKQAKTVLDRINRGKSSAGKSTPLNKDIHQSHTVQANRKGNVTPYMKSNRSGSKNTKNNLFKTDRQYSLWINELKNKIRSVQIKAAIKVNSEVLGFYWELGSDIVEKQTTAKWGEGFLAQLSTDLIREFPDVHGFSERNLRAIRQWFLFYSGRIGSHTRSPAAIRLQPVAELSRRMTVQVPWGHNLIIIGRSRTPDEALFYLKKTIQNNWSRSVLIHHIEKLQKENSCRIYA